MADFMAKWHRELDIFTKIKPFLLLEGNVLDSYQYPVEGSTPKGSILRLPEYLHYYFKDAGYHTVVFYDTLVGFSNPYEEGQVERFGSLVGEKNAGRVMAADFKGREALAPIMIEKALSQTNESAVIVMNFASRCIVSPDMMDQSEVDSFTRLLQASLVAKDLREEGVIRKNLLVFILNKVNDLPAWFYLANPNVKSISLSYPAKEERESLVKGQNFPGFFAADIYNEDMRYYALHQDELVKIQDRFVALTEGFSFTEINGLRRLSKNERLHLRDMADAVDLYKYGIRENPWKKLDFAAIREGETRFRRRVKGQAHAIGKTLDVIKRAVTGLSGLQGSSHNRPKGILFFAGPTGVGKTETAKTLAELLFGDESCCIRFDMSEYQQSHSDQKLLGAPPGYVGYEAGGQLTNAVKKNPFSILLFDEIEKAHPSIMDKFLGILEDGRMTDGQGNTVYFSECVIIFTSNLGIYTDVGNGRLTANVTPDMPYEEMARRVRGAIEDHFKTKLGRPEILNRIGENIVVFDYIRPDVAREILAGQLARITAWLAEERKITLRFSETAEEELLALSLENLSNGGRGIGNLVEKYLLDPLARFLFDEAVQDGETVTFKGKDHFERGVC